VPEAPGWVELATLEVLDEGVAEDAVPAIEVGQLLRSFPQRGEEGSDADEGAPGAMMLAWALVTMMVVWLACWVRRPIAWSRSGRLVIVLRCWSGSARRTNRTIFGISVMQAAEIAAKAIRPSQQLPGPVDTRHRLRVLVCWCRTQRRIGRPLFSVAAWPVGAARRLFNTRELL
jgi:hypothetical protein